MSKIPESPESPEGSESYGILGTKTSEPNYLNGTKKFVQFGCWNKGLCEDGNDIPLKRVTDALKSYVLEERPEFVVVAGDNYYPDSITNEAGKKIKTVVADNLRSGFDCLPKNIDIKMILGNHDLEDITDTDTDCSITRQEIGLTLGNIDSKIDLIVFDAVPLDETLLLLIDTTMYDPEKATEYLNCYRNMPRFDSIETIEDLQYMQQQYILKRVQNFTGKNIILVGHHPITGYKYKKEKKEEENTEKNEKKEKGEKKKGEKKEKKKKQKGVFLINAFPNFIGLLTNIFNEIARHNVNYYYLCADLHLYQEGIVTIPITGGGDMLITQYIVGTGGTDLDPSPFEAPVEAFEDGRNDTLYNSANFTYNDGAYAGTYTMRETEKTYGFLVCNYSNPEHLGFEFIPVTMGESSASAMSEPSASVTMSESSTSAMSEPSASVTMSESLDSVTTDTTGTKGGRRSKHKRKSKSRRGKSKKSRKSRRKSRSSKRRRRH